MNIFHCLFWIKDNMVVSILYEPNGLNIIKIRGRKAVTLTDAFWDEWREYAGMCSGDKTDICLIYDKKTMPDEQLLSTQCESADCIWSRTKIEEALKMIEITEPTEIRDENGMLLVKAGCFMNVKKEDIVLMTACYRKSDKNAEKTDLSEPQMTGFLKHYHEELLKYKKGYERGMRKK